MKKVKLAYFGTPDFSALLLEKLLNNRDLPIEIVLVVTQPPQPVGRKQMITTSPVEQRIRSNQHFSTVKLATLKQLTAQNFNSSQIDLGLLFAFGEMIPKEILEIPTHGFWNVHPSLLPQYRGPSPIAAPLIHGDVETGVSIMKMDEKLDHGPIIAQKKTYIFPVWRRDQLTNHLVDVAYEMLCVLFQTYSDKLNDIPSVPQEHEKATYTTKLHKNDGYIEFSKLKVQISNSSKELFNLFRGLYPWPGIWTKVNIRGEEKRLKITKMHWEHDQIIIKKVQLEGKNEVDFDIFNRAYHLFS